jgi:hypothetical protein
LFFEEGVPGVFVNRNRIQDRFNLIILLNLYEEIESLPQHFAEGQNLPYQKSQCLFFEEGVPGVFVNRNRIQDRYFLKLYEELDSLLQHFAEGQNLAYQKTQCLFFEEGVPGVFVNRNRSQD